MNFDEKNEETPLNSESLEPGETIESNGVPEETENNIGEEAPDGQAETMREGVDGLSAETSADMGDASADVTTENAEASESDVIAESEPDGIIDGIIDESSEHDGVNGGETEDAAATSWNAAQINEAALPAKSKKPFIIGGVVLVAALAVFALINLFQSPVQALMKAKEVTSGDYERFIENALFSREKKYAEMTPKTEARFSFKLDSISTSSGLPLAVLNGGEISGVLNIDEEAKRLDVELEAKLQNESIINADLNLDGEVLSVNMPELLDTVYLSADFNTLNDDITENPFGGYFGIPQLDYASYTAEVFSLSDKINRINGAGGPSQMGEFGNVLPLFSPAAEKLDKDISITTGKDVLNGQQLKTYELNLSQDFVQRKYREQTTAIVEAYAAEFNRSMEAFKSVAPGLYNAYSPAIVLPSEGLRETFERITFTEPVKAVYYVDKSNKIRRSLYSAAVSLDGQPNNIVLDIMKNGAKNVYDSVDITLTAETASELFTVTIMSEGNHSDKKEFTDNSKITVSHSAGEYGQQSDVTIDSAIKYIAETNDVEQRLEITDSSMPGIIAFELRGRTETDEAAKTFEAAYDKIGIDFPGLSATFGLSYGYGPAGDIPREGAGLNGQELFKMNEAEMIELFNRINNNYQTLIQRIMALFGM